MTLEVIMLGLELG